MIISNLFFIEWAYEDYKALRYRNSKLTWRQLLRRTFCCCCKKKYNTEASESTSTERVVASSHPSEIEAAFDEEFEVDEHYEK